MRRPFTQVFFFFFVNCIYSFLDLFLISLRVLSVDIFGWLVFLSSCIIFPFPPDFIFIICLFGSLSIRVCVFFFRFFSLIDYYKVLSIVSRAIYWLSVLCVVMCIRHPSLVSYCRCSTPASSNRFVPLTSSIEVHFMYSGVHPPHACISGIFGNVLSGVTVTTSQRSACPLPSQGPPSPFTVNPPVPSQGPRQRPTYFLSIICPFWTSCINKTMPHVVAGVCFLSLRTMFQGSSRCWAWWCAPLAGWHSGCGQAVFCPPVCQLTDVAVVPRFWLLGGAPSAGVWAWPLRCFPKSSTWSLPQKKRGGVGLPGSPASLSA